MNSARSRYLLFWGLLVLHIVPVWIFRFFPTQDGPTHLANATLLRLYDDPAFGSARHIHELSPELVPNWLVFVLLERLMDFMPPLLAEKILLTAYLLTLPLAIRHLLRTIRGREAADGYALLAFPLTANAFLFLGFYNFILSLPLYALLLAAWIRGRDRWTAPRWLALALGITLLYFCHLVTWVLLGLTFGILAAADGKSGPRALLGRLVPAALAFLPGAVLTLAFVGSRSGELPHWLPLPWLLRSFLRAQSIAVFSYAELPWTMGLLGLLGTLAWKARGDAFRVLALALLALHFLGPDSIAGRDTITWRVGWFCLLAMLFAASARPAPRWLVAAALGLTLPLWCVRLERIAALDEALHEYVSVGEHLPENSTLLPLSYAHHGATAEGGWMSRWVHPFRHAGGYLAAGRRVVDLSNYAADTNAFPIRYRAGHNPHQWLYDLEGQPPCGKLEGGELPDFVLLWQEEAAPPDHPCVLEMNEALARLYRLVEVSKPNGWAKLYRRK